MTQTTLPPAQAPAQGLTLKTSAIRKIEQARTLLDSARHDLCNLEGPGYSAQFARVGKFDQDLGKLTQRLRDMPPPTGVFHI